MDTILKVSVVLPVYNGEKTIEEAARSILSQSYENFELLIVDDCSKDRTPTIVDSFQDARVRVFHLPENVGRAEARNFGISVARGVYLAMMDADDISFPDRLRLQVSFMEDRPDVALCGAWANLREPSGQRIEWRQPLTTNEIRASIFRSNAFIHCTVMFRRSIVKEVGVFDPSMEPAEDYDLYLRITSRSPVANLPCVLAEYSAHTGLSYRIKEQWAKLPVRWRAIRLYGYPLTNMVYLVTPFLTLFFPLRYKLHLKSRSVPNRVG